MLYLDERWLNGGLESLRKEFEHGYKGFAKKAATKDHGIIALR